MLAAFESDVVSEITRQEGDARAEEILRRDQKRSTGTGAGSRGTHRARRADSGFFNYDQLGRPDTPRMN